MLFRSVTVGLLAVGLLAIRLLAIGLLAVGLLRATIGLLGLHNGNVTNRFAVVLGTVGALFLAIAGVVRAVMSTVALFLVGWHLEATVSLVGL